MHRTLGHTVRLCCAIQTEPLAGVEALTARRRQGWQSPLRLQPTPLATHAEKPRRTAPPAAPRFWTKSPPLQRCAPAASPAAKHQWRQSKEGSQRNPAKVGPAPMGNLGRCLRRCSSSTSANAARGSPCKRTRGRGPRAQVSVSGAAPRCAAVCATVANTTSSIHQPHCTSPSTIPCTLLENACDRR